MKCQKIFDARRLPRAAKAQLRHAAVKRVETGEGPEAVAAGMGLNRRTIYRWLAAYHTGGKQPYRPNPFTGLPPN
jgi:transposase